jgi:hypothetical protein
MDGDEDRGSRRNSGKKGLTRAARRGLQETNAAVG